MLNKFKDGFSAGRKDCYSVAITIVHYSICMGLIAILLLFSIGNFTPTAVIVVILLSCIVSKHISTISAKIVFFVGRNGRVISRKDWRRIKKNAPKLYHNMWYTNKYQGHCYYYSRALALEIEGAELVYLTVSSKYGDISHAVIRKNGSVFDTNARMHFSFDEYIKLNSAYVFKIYSKDEYCDENFFDNIRQELVDYCSENNIYCNPQ